MLHEHARLMSGQETLRETLQLIEQSSSNPTCESSQVQQTSQAKITAGK